MASPAIRSKARICDMAKLSGVSVMTASHGPNGTSHTSAEEKPSTMSGPRRKSSVHANEQSNNWWGVAYWYQSRTHTPHPRLLPIADRRPRRHPEHCLWDE